MEPQRGLAAAVQLLNLFGGAFIKQVEKQTANERLRRSAFADGDVSRVHIVFAVLGVGLPLMMTITEWRWHRTGDAAYLLFAKRWAKGTAILFAIGALSGTVLSFELGLLWPRFIELSFRRWSDVEPL